MRSISVDLVQAIVVMFGVLPLVLVTSYQCGSLAPGSNMKYANCSKNCSQDARFDGDTNFPCSIGYSKEVAEFRRKYNDVFASTDVNFDIVQLLDVQAIYSNKYSKNSNQLSLSITFKLPRAQTRVGSSHSVYHVQPSAILLMLQSVSDRHVRDKYYYECPCQRLFNFSEYHTVLGASVEKPRNITYDCFTGLQDINNSFNVYEITIGAVLGRNATYNVSVPVYGHGAWQPAIATYMNVSHRSLTVIVARLPEDLRSANYTVSLVNILYQNYNKTKQLNATVNVFTFNDLTSGVYTVYVKSKSCPKHGRKCLGFEPYRVNASSIPRVLEEDVTMDSTKLAAMVIGCVVGVLLLALGVLVTVKGKQLFCGAAKSSSDNRQVQPCIILHPFSTDDTTGKYYSVVTEFKKYLETHCECSIVRDSPWNKNEDHSKLNQCKYAFVFFKADLCISSQKDPDDSYSHTWKLLDHRKRQENGIMIILVTFPTLKLDKPRFLSEYKVFLLMRDMQAIYCMIHCINSVEISANKRTILGEQSYKSCPEGTDLYQAIDYAIKDENPKSTDPLLHHNDKPVGVAQNNLKNKKEIHVPIQINIQKNACGSTEKTVCDKENDLYIQAKLDRINKFNLVPKDKGARPKTIGNSLPPCECPLGATRSSAVARNNDVNKHDKPYHSLHTTTADVHFNLSDVHGLKNFQHEQFPLSHCDNTSKHQQRNKLKPFPGFVSYDRSFSCPAQDSFLRAETDESDDERFHHPFTDSRHRNHLHDDHVSSLPYACPSDLNSLIHDGFQKNDRLIEKTAQHSDVGELRNSLFPSGLKAQGLPEETAMSPESRASHFTEGPMFAHQNLGHHPLNNPHGHPSALTSTQHHLGHSEQLEMHSYDRHQPFRSPIITDQDQEMRHLHLKTPLNNHNALKTFNNPHSLIDPNNGQNPIHRNHSNQEQVDSRVQEFQEHIPYHPHSTHHGYHRNKLNNTLDSDHSLLMPVDTNGMHASEGMVRFHLGNDSKPCMQPFKYENDIRPTPQAQKEPIHFQGVDPLAIEQRGENSKDSEGSSYFTGSRLSTLSSQSSSMPSGLSAMTDPFRVNNSADSGLDAPNVDWIPPDDLLSSTELLSEGDLMEEMIKLNSKSIGEGEMYAD